MKKIIICLTVCAMVFGFYACRKASVCKEPESMNLPALDWDTYHDIKTLSPYGCHYGDNNDTIFRNLNRSGKIKLMGWFVSGGYSYILSDDERVTTDNDFKSDVTIEIVGYNFLGGQMRQLIDSVDITQKCYVIGTIGFKKVFQDHPNSCPKYIPVFIVFDIKNISFGKEVEDEN